MFIIGLVDIRRNVVVNVVIIDAKETREILVQQYASTLRLTHRELNNNDNEKY